jgi:hypothetical protein
MKRISRKGNVTTGGDLHPHGGDAPSIVNRGHTCWARSGCFHRGGGNAALLQSDGVKSWYVGGTKVDPPGGRG